MPNPRSELRERRLTLGEEIANSVTHGVALAASIAALPLLIVAAAARGDPWQIVGGSIFGATLILLYAASTLYHALPHSRAKRVFRVLDHSAIYLLIAGTYTPFALGALRGAWGWALFGSVWTLAVLGITAKATLGFRFPRLSAAVYRGDGMAGRCRDSPVIDRAWARGDHVADRGRALLHGRRRVLCVGTPPVRPHGLAYLRHGGQRLPLFRGAVVRGVRLLSLWQGQRTELPNHTKKARITRILRNDVAVFA